MELNAEQIIKALEWCALGFAYMNCKYDKGKQFSKEGCMALHMRDALSLIKELTEENERLRAEVRKLNIIADDTDVALYAYQHLFDIRADTVREMRSILYEEFIKVARCQKSGEPNMKSQEVFAILDRIAQEMLEGEK